MFKKTAVALMKAGLVCFATLLMSRPYTHAQNSTDEKIGLANLSEVRLDGDYFSHNGKRFVPVGAHWVPAKAAMQFRLRWKRRRSRVITADISYS